MIIKSDADTNIIFCLIKKKRKTYKVAQINYFPDIPQL